MLLIAVGIYSAVRLKKSEELWKFALEGAGDGVWDWDIKNDVAHFSNRYKEMFGFSDSDINTSIREWNSRIHPEDAKSMSDAVNSYLTGKSEKYINEHRVICKDKSIKWVLSRGMIIKRDRNGEPLRMVGTHTDITERKLLEKRLENLAHFDALANIPNRTLFNDRLKLALAYAKREKKQLAVMFIDLDLFKEINDLYGHETGDIVLKKVSRQLVSCVRESDTVARMGGDEFVVLLPIIDNETDVILVADKILDSVAKPIKVEKLNLHVTCSIGIAIYPQHGKDEKLLVINADMAMYQAKKGGKNQAKFFDETMKE
ncbi:MAG: diguanylate cyclase [Methylotenera sp.]|nr:diguanylate cyclase [Methylotenera sp.]